MEINNEIKVPVVFIAVGIFFYYYKEDCLRVYYYSELKKLKNLKILKNVLTRKQKDVNIILLQIRL